MDDRAETIEELGTQGGMVIARAMGRRFPGVLIQGDTLSILLADLEKEAPQSEACAQVRQWLENYESFMKSRGLALPYFRS
jgi:hypothetical protein